MKARCEWCLTELRVTPAAIATADASGRIFAYCPHCDSFVWSAMEPPLKTEHLKLQTLP